MTTPRTIGLTAIAMIAFAANSILCRLALEAGHIDAATFTTIRTASGAMTLMAFLLLSRQQVPPAAGQWRSAAMLFVYMTFFSFAYLTLGAATGALILFGAVQLTMFAVALLRGERFPALSWAGLATAFGGIVYLVSPGVTAPDFLGAVLMAIAGIAWGLYSLAGQGASSPLASSTANFVLCLPLVAVVSVVFWDDYNATATGITLAIASGALASGWGYVIWYAALPHLTAGRAATVQLSVPVIAAIAAVLFLAEPVTARLALASVITLGGVFLVLSQRNRTAAG